MTALDVLPDPADQDGPSITKGTAAPSRPTVSVIVPCYNYGRYLPACVESILSQAGVDVSVLILDDCSTDGSYEVSYDLAAGDQRVEAVRHRVNLGHIATYNEGIEWVTGTYTLLLSADDLLVDGALLRATSVFDAHPEVGLVYGRAVLFPDGSSLPAPRVSSSVKVWPGAAWVASRCRMGRTGIESPEAMLRTEVQRAVGGYRSDLPHTGDSELWMRAAHYADVAYLCADQAYHRTHPASMSSSRFGVLQSDYEQRQAAFEIALLHGTRRLPETGGLYATAMQALASDLLWRVCRSYDAGRGADLPIADIVQLARRFHPQLDELPELRALEWRRRFGRTARYGLPLAIPSMLLRRVRRLRHQYGPLWWRNLQG